MNFIEEIILFLFTLILMLCFNINKSFSYDDLHRPKASRSTIECASSTIRGLKNIQYIFIGEDHRDRNSKLFIMDQLKNFKELNFKVFFAEYIESKDQFLADQFNSDFTLYRESLFRAYGLPGDLGHDPEGYLLLTDTLGELGVYIYGLDRRSDLRKLMSLDEQMAIRDKHMFEVANQFIEKNPDQKIIFFNGSSHSYLNDSLKSPSFFELFTNRYALHYKNKKIINLKVDYLDPRSISKERLNLSQKIDQIPNCPNDKFIFFKNFERTFDYFVFPNTKDVLPIQDYPKTSFI